MAIELKGGHTTEDPRLDRIPQFDEKSRQFAIRELLPPQPPKSRTWAAGPWLDQGREGACVGFSWSGELAASPVREPHITNESALAIYHRAQQLDDDPGENYSGTSVLAGAKAVVETGAMTEYRWAFGLQDVIDTIGHVGPVVFGINWYEGMYDADSNGFIHATGQLAGGHAIMGRGVNFEKKYVRFRNSWGKDWGRLGDCFISFDDLDKLLHEQGEACIPVKRVLIK